MILIKVLRYAEFIIENLLEHIGNYAQVTQYLPGKFIAAIRLILNMRSTPLTQRTMIFLRESSETLS